MKKVITRIINTAIAVVAMSIGILSFSFAFSQLSIIPLTWFTFLVLVFLGWIATLLGFGIFIEEYP